MSNVAILKKDTADAVAERVRQLQDSRQLHLPADYSAENALKSAWLILQNTVDRDKKSVLATCTKESIINSLFDMVVQGLNPAKKQGYFIAYGNQLVFQRSYFGTMALAKRVDPTIQEVIAEVVYQGDKFKYKIVRGKKEITEHEQALENIGKPILAAYCMIVNQDGEVTKTDIMTIDEIKQAWKQSQMKPVDESGQIKAGSTHEKFTAEMAKKTVINRTCKSIINSSSDSSLFIQAVNRADGIQAEEELAAEIEANANMTTIDVNAERVDTETGEVLTAPESPDPPAPDTPQRPAGAPQQQAFGPTGPDGPGF